MRILIQEQFKRILTCKGCLRLLIGNGVRDQEHCHCDNVQTADLIVYFKSGV